MNKSLYIFRHGETDWNVEKRTQGWIDIPLNNNGISQAEDLANIMKSISLDIIYSSPLSRALATAKIVAKPNNTPIIMHDDLKEKNLGVLGGKIVRITSNPDDEQLDFTQDIIVMPASLMKDPDFKPESGESLNSAVSRLYSAILDIAKKTNGQKIGISTHGGVTRGMLEKLAGYDLPVGAIPNASYFKLNWDGEKLSLNELPEWLKSNQTPKGGE